MRKSSSRLARDPGYDYVEVVGRPTYRDVVRVVENDDRLPPPGYRAVVERRRGRREDYGDDDEPDPRARQQQQGNDTVATSILKLAGDVRNLAEALDKLRECGKEMADRCDANQTAIEQLRESIKELKPPPPPPQQYEQPPQQYYAPPPQQQPPQQYEQPPQQQPPQQYEQPPQQYYEPQPQPYYEPQQYYGSAPPADQGDPRGGYYTPGYY
jgi:hypothetical protein